MFTHEYAHILQLDQSAGWAAGVEEGARPIPGVAFPNLALPTWEVEGFATYIESRETGRGPLARAAMPPRSSASACGGRGPNRWTATNGGVVEWPGGDGPYLYGGLFHEYLASRFGEEKLGELFGRSAARLHYFSAGAFRPVFDEEPGERCGATSSATWPDQSPTPEPADHGRRLTRHGFFVGAPRFSPDGAFLIYSLQTPHGFPTLS